VKCPQCKADNIEGKNFCSDCGSLLTPQLKPLVRAQVEECIKEYVKDQKVVDIETTEAIVERFHRWAKWFLVPATILLAILGLVFALLGFSDYTAFRKTVQRATDELKPKLEQALNEADSATKKAQDAEGKANDAVKSINAATGKLSKASGLESQTSNQIANASKHVEEGMSELDKKVEAANKQIAAQQEKLTNTNDLVTAMFSKGLNEYFQTEPVNTSCVVYPLPVGQQGAIVYMRLKNAPIFQTVQLQWHVAVQPKYSYSVLANILRFTWGDPAAALKVHPFVVSYVPDPTYHGVVYSALSVKDGHVIADSVQLQ
jgi:F0F1-type ATP synthase membrane subunit b/b'